MWFRHPKYLNARKDFIKNFSPSELNQLNYSLPKILFICGGEDKTCKNRGFLEHYIKRHHKEYLTFRAELAWEVISSNDKGKNVNALALEEWLADIFRYRYYISRKLWHSSRIRCFFLKP
ncbi:hypothetical protein Pcaca05_11180 [Pectobacterium carotovorum subsp. carotovorum]|nr:hypothetical protein Pcaca05_11180 [Pectobacterium carotovorum subsp. carotovorum]